MDMIVTEFYNGQGLGNQLWSYVATRVIALDKGWKFGIIHAERFKGADFLTLDFGYPVSGGESPEGGPPTKLPDGIEHYFLEKGCWHQDSRSDVRGLDKRLFDLGSNTKIEGYFQSEALIEHRRSEICDWLKIQPADYLLGSPEKTCVLNIRGGEYRFHPDLLLLKKYWLDAMQAMKKIRADLEFIVITDDQDYCKKLFPDIPNYHFNVGKDYGILHFAKYLILSNSSFAFFPVWTNSQNPVVIAPKYWARHNVSDGYWACEFNLYKNWLWLDRSGQLFDYESCSQELAAYKNILPPQTFVDVLPPIQQGALQQVMKYLWKIKNSLNWRV